MKYYVGFLDVQFVSVWSAYPIRNEAINFHSYIPLQGHNILSFFIITPTLTFFIFIQVHTCGWRSEIFGVNTPKRCNFKAFYSVFDNIFSFFPSAIFISFPAHSFSPRIFCIIHMHSVSNFNSCDTVPVDVQYAT